MNGCSFDGARFAKFEAFRVHCTFALCIQPISTHIRSFMGISTESMPFTTDKTGYATTNWEASPCAKSVESRDAWRWRRLMSRMTGCC